MHAPGLNLDAAMALGRALRTPTAVFGRRIGPRLRELVILHVSSVNGCPVCSSVHAVIARRVGVGEEGVQAARLCHAMDARLDARERVALRYAELRTLGREAEDRESIEELDALFSRDEQREIRAIVDLFTFNNRFNNTWERWVPGARARRERMGLCETP